MPSFVFHPHCLEVQTCGPKLGWLILWYDWIYEKKRIKKRETNRKHIDKVVTLNTLRRTNILTILSNTYHESLEKHIKQIEKNRYILSRIIGCGRFCDAFEIALRGHDESEESENSSVFGGLIDFVSELDSAVIWKNTLIAIIYLKKHKKPYINYYTVC